MHKTKSTLLFIILGLFFFGLFFSEVNISAIQHNKIVDQSAPVPHHIAIIMDGNRRWAKMRGKAPVQGYVEGEAVLMHTIRAAAKMGVKVLTVFAFSTENWARPSNEVEFLLGLMEKQILKYKENMGNEGIKLRVIGDISKFPKSIQENIFSVVESTKHGKTIEFVVALNYGGRNEILRATKKIVQDCKQGKISQKDISEQLFSNYLDTARLPDPDLLIRTSSENRLSNFLLWQLSYTELYMMDVLWPDFTAHHLADAIAVYQSRKRRFGG